MTVLDSVAVLLSFAALQLYSRAFGYIKMCKAIEHKSFVTEVSKMCKTQTLFNN